MIYYWIFLSQ